MGISVVVPTFNMGDHVVALWDSFAEAGLLDVVSEVVIVDDGSTDDTRRKVASLSSRPNGERVRLVALPHNVGRFEARLAGARAAKEDRLLFLDSRATLAVGFGPALAAAAAKFPSVMGNVDIDTDRSIFALYWDRSHRRIFRRHYEATKRVLTLTPENYDAYLKGTGVFLCDRTLFLETCGQFSELLSDDTFLMREIVKTTPITIDPAVRIGWVPREDWKGFLLRLWERGPQFVEYQVFERRSGLFFWITVVGTAGLVGLVGLSVVSPPAGAMAVGSLVGLTALSTVVFARSLREAVKMAPLHVAVVTTFGAGIVRGIAVNTKRAWMGRLPRRAPVA